MDVWSEEELRKARDVLYADIISDSELTDRIYKHRISCAACAQ
jgi:hypothetical protein